MAQGTVKWYDPRKGYGFIRVDDGEEIFVHQDAIEAEGFGTLAPGDRVEFDVTQGRKGRQAVKVSKLK